MSMENLLTTKQAAEYLNVSVAFLERSRWSGIPAINYISVGPRAVRYRLSDLNAYIEENTRTTTIKK